MPRTRTFIAVDIGAKIRDRIVAFQETLAASARDVKWVEADNLHVTLLFLGEVDNREVARVCRMVQDGVQGQEPFSMSVETAGCFPNPRRPRILWVGIGEGSDELVAIHDALETPLQELGYRREERRYTPHITLGRAKGDDSSDAIAAALTKHADWSGGVHVVQEVLIMSSELRSEGPKYTVLGRAKLS